MNYSTLSATPSAYITKRKSRLKIYDEKNVYLNDGENFEFELYNPKQKSVLVKIKLNGEYISQSGIVLKPGQRVFLERFLDTNNKFEFSTYKVKDTSENRSAIDLNGDIEIEFYEQQTITINPNLTIGSTGSYNGINLFNTVSTPTTQPYWYGNPTYTTSNLNAFTYTSNVSSFNSSTTPEGPNIRSFKAKKSIETGRVEKGDESKQTFSTNYDKFNNYTSYVTVYKILPLSTKNKMVEEIRQYCSECGVRTKKNYKFCPSCGNNLNSKKETIIKYTEGVTDFINGKIYTMKSFNLSLPKLLELYEGKTIIIHKPSLSEDKLRAIII